MNKIKKIPNISNMFRELAMNHVKGYQNLNESQKDMFDKTYKNHLSSISMDKRLNYTENQIVKIKQGTEENILKVHFNNGECFIYLSNYRWIRVP